MTTPADPAAGYENSVALKVDRALKRWETWSHDPWPVDPL